MADSKLPARALSLSAARTAALKLWTDRLSPAIGAALLDDLIRLIGEYCLSRLSWSPVLHAKRIVITDADADGFGRSLELRREPPAGVTEDESPLGWYAALSAAPLSELAGDLSTFSWAVRVDDWTNGCLTVGVASADATCYPPGYGVSDRAYGVFLDNARAGMMPVHAGMPLPEAEAMRWAQLPRPSVESGTTVQVRATADLKANSVRFAVEHVPCAGDPTRDEPVTPLKRMDDPSWVMTVSQLAGRHLYVAAGDALKLRLIP